MASYKQIKGTVKEIRATKDFRHLEDLVPEVEERIAEQLDLEHYEGHPSWEGGKEDGENYDGPILRDKEGNGYVIAVQVLRDDD